ncbi:cell division protein PerM [Demequina globuliformis]|uniref:cell division protein PerM n=1 Tax=Demequina globuliformis TaxID=676202 RepID=UPI000785266F|nr:DUF6350 family protein [Demequina globuliformis]
MPRSLTHDARALAHTVKGWFAGYPGWVGGVLTGLQGALIPYLVVVVLSLAVIASDPGATTSSGINWGSAFSVATTVFLMAHGVPAVAGGVTFTLLPAGLTLLCGAVVAACARRFATRSWVSWGLATGAYVAVVGVIGTFALGSDADGGSLVVRACTVAAMVAGASAAIGIWRAHGASFSWILELPDWARRGLRRGTATMALVVCAASVAAVVTVVMHGGQMAQWATGLGVDAIGGIVLAIAQLAYAPAFIVWMLSYLAGPGFAVGEGTSFSPGVAQADALPQIPLLAALPDATATWLVWLPALLAVLAGVARVMTRRRAALTWEDAASDGVALAVAAVVTGGLAAMASGAMGPGVLASTGPAIVPVTASVIALTLAGYATVTVGIAAVQWRARRRARASVSGTEPERPVTRPDNETGASARSEAEATPRT